MVASIREFGFAIPILARSTGEVIDGHLRLKGVVADKLAELPVILCDGRTEAQVKAFRLTVNRSVTWAAWDPDALKLADTGHRGVGNLLRDGPPAKPVAGSQLAAMAALLSVVLVGDADMRRRESALSFIFNAAHHLRKGSFFVQKTGSTTENLRRRLGTEEIKSICHRARKIRSKVSSTK
jgi:hypothetical protein